MKRILFSHFLKMEKLRIGHLNLALTADTLWSWDWTPSNLIPEPLLLATTPY